MPSVVISTESPLLFDVRPGLILGWFSRCWWYCPLGSLVSCCDILMLRPLMSNESVQGSKSSVTVGLRHHSPRRCLIRESSNLIVHSLPQLYMQFSFSFTLLDQSKLGWIKFLSRFLSKFSRCTFHLTELLSLGFRSMYLPNNDLWFYVSNATKNAPLPHFPAWDWSAFRPSLLRILCERGEDMVRVTLPAEKSKQTT